MAEATLNDPKLILRNDAGFKIFQVGELKNGDYSDKLIKVMLPNGTWAWDGPGIPLVRYMKFSGVTWYDVGS